MTKYVNIVDVEHEVQCELKQFLTDESTTYPINGINVSSANIANNLLAFDQSATVTLTVQTDLTGKVTATGINLNKVGLEAIADVITLSNKAPTLQANLSAKGTVVASPVVVFPQTARDVWQIYVKDDDGNAKLIPIIPDDDLSLKLINKGKLISKGGVETKNSFDQYFYTVLRKNSGNLKLNENELFQDMKKAKLADDKTPRDGLHQPAEPIIKGLDNVVCPDVGNPPANFQPTFVIYI